jgi:hypothetical protein
MLQNKADPNLQKKVTSRRMMLIIMISMMIDDSDAYDKYDDVR